MSKLGSATPLSISVIPDGIDSIRTKTQVANNELGKMLRLV